MIEILNITKTFKINNDREHVVLNDISFTLPNKGLYFILLEEKVGVENQLF